MSDKKLNNMALFIFGVSGIVWYLFGFIVCVVTLCVLCEVFGDYLKD